MIFSTRAHVLQNAKIAGLILDDPDEYGVPNWIGTKGQFGAFNLLESNPELE